MKTTIDRAGRVVIPKALRQLAGFQPGTELDLKCSGGVIEIAVRPAQGKLVREGPLLVWESAAATPITLEAVNLGIEELREERVFEIESRSGL